MTDIGRVIPNCIFYLFVRSLQKFSLKYEFEDLLWIGFSFIILNVS